MSVKLLVEKIYWHWFKIMPAEMILKKKWDAFRKIERLYYGHGFDLNCIRSGGDWIVNFLISRDVRRMDFIEQPTCVYCINGGSMITSSIRAWSYAERVHRCLSLFDETLPESINQMREMRSSLSQLQYFFMPEVPFNWTKYRELKKRVPIALEFLKDEIHIPSYYYRFINNAPLYYIYSRMICFAKYVLKQKCHKRKEIK